MNKKGTYKVKIRCMNCKKKQTIKVIKGYTVKYYFKYDKYKWECEFCKCNFKDANFRVLEPVENGE